MMTDSENTIHDILNKDELRERFLEFTRKAFFAIPTLKHPRILDIGCGSGIPALELAKLSAGEVIAFDIDEASIRKSRERIEQAGLSGRVSILRASLFKIPLSVRSFDIVWAEGTISIIGFNEGLDRWRKLLKPKGYMVIHDDEEGAEEKRNTISECGFILIKEFCISSDTWRERYFVPLKRRIDRLSSKYRNNEEAKRILGREQAEAERYGSAPHGSIFFIMQSMEVENDGKGKDHYDR